MLFVGKRDAQNAQERIQGIREALAGSGIDIIDVRTDDVDDVRAKSNAADTLVRYPDVKALVGVDRWLDTRTSSSHSISTS